MQFDATFFVGLAFVVFVGVLVYFGVHKMLLKSLDERASAIRDEIDEAQRLREEAQALLAGYERKQRDALKEAEEMVAHAREEAEREARESIDKLDAALARREQLALDKIALAEAQAEREVRAAAVDLAIDAAAKVIETQVAGARGEALVDDAIKDLRQRLN
ncbi:MAG: ATP F0F1 synthase subunit B [Alphaproteobacteria bacterium]